MATAAATRRDGRTGGGTERVDVYQAITDRLVALLEAGTAPWQKPWTVRSDMPRNLLSGKAYRGINVWMLLHQFDSPYWMTYRQAQEKGGQVRKGEKSSVVVFWKFLERENAKTGRRETIPMLRQFHVFNLRQVDGITDPDLSKEGTPALEHTPVYRCEEIILGMPSPPLVRYGYDRAAYAPILDQIQMPTQSSFRPPEAFYATLFHELIHATGHPTRLDRQGSAGCQPFGTPDYSREELVAEMGAAMLCGVAEIENSVIENSAAYLRSWINRLQGDSRLAVTAAGQAQRASDWILNVRHDTVTEGDEESTS